MGVLDYELDYAENLMSYLNHKDNFPLEVVVFSGMGSMEAFLRAGKLEILLIGEDMLTQDGLPENIGQVILLSEKGGFIGEEYPVAYKFQSAEKLALELLSYYEESKQYQNQQLLSGDKVKTELLAVSSPQGGSGKTTFSLALGTAYAKEEKVLYMGMEPFGSSFLMTEEENGIADLIYYVKQRKKNLISLIDTISVRTGQLECVVSNGDFSDLQSMDSNDIDFLLKELNERGDYQKVIFDLGYLDQTIFYLMERCQRIYITSLHRDQFMDKSRAWKQAFAFGEKPELINRMNFLKLPYDHKLGEEGFCPETVLSGELGKMVEEFIKMEEQGVTV